jgi:hypothetical protein
VGAALAAGAWEPAAAGEPSDGEVQGLRFERTLLASQLDLAKKGTPYFRVNPWAGELELLVGGVVVSRFPAEKCLVGRDVKRQLTRKDPTAPIAKPFAWAGFERGEEGAAAASMSMLLRPTLRIDFEGSPSNFFWRWLRFQLQGFGLIGRKDSGMSLVLFYHPDSLATLTPLLDDSLAVLVSPFTSGGLGGATPPR